TRWPRDWSSDVCSSDLPWQEKMRGLASSRHAPHLGRFAGHHSTASTVFPPPNLTVPLASITDANNETPSCSLQAHTGNATTTTRSEERRVGREYRTRRT